MQVQIIGRTGGRSIFAAVAYRTGDVIVDRRSGQTFDYQSRHGVRAHEILTPPDTPPIENSQDLWDRADACEVRADAQLAREFIGSLPHELTLDEQRQCVREFYDEHLAPLGIVLDGSYHGADRRGDARNLHGHFLTTLRPYRSDGTFGPKTALRHLNFPAQLILWREGFERCVNRALKRAMINQRVRLSQHSLFPEPHQGPLATELERRGVRTFAGEARREVRAERESFEAFTREARPPPDKPLLRLSERQLDDVVARYAPETSNASTKRAPSIEHPGRDRWHEFSTTNERYREAIAQSSLSSWRATATEAGIMFTLGKKKIEDRGGKIVVGDEKSVDVEAILDLIQAKGWNEVRLTGSARYKAMVALGALGRGIRIVSDDKDKPLLREVQRIFDQQQAARGIDERAKRAGEDLRAPAAPEPEKTIDAIAAEALVLLTQQTSTFGRRDVVRFAERVTTDEVARAELVAMILANPEVQQVGVDQIGAPRYSTTETLATERQSIDWTIEMASETAPRFVTSAAFRDDVAKKKTFAPEQSDALEKLTSSARFVAVLGRAGTGKSYLMGGARETWEHDGLRVRGCALAGKAADGLQADAGIESSTIASLLLKLEPREGHENEKPLDPLDDRTVLVVDEIGMVGSRDYCRLVRLCHDAGAKLVVLGDPEQLQPIAAGAPFRAALERLPESSVGLLKDVRRQKVEWMREATNYFASDRTADGLALYDTNGFVHESKTRDEAKDALVEKCRIDRAAFPEGTQIVLAYTRDDVRSLNERIRTLRKDAGELGAELAVSTDNGERTFAVNDRVYFLENNRDLGVKNGTLGTVVAIKGNVITVAADGRGERIDVDTKAYNKLDHGYAATVHKSQGVTVDRAYFLATAHAGMDRHLSYVACSRHRFGLDVYWSDDQFKTRRQLDRVLSRDGRKDFTLDYTAGDGVGYGVPQQGHGDVALRAPYQLRIELKNVLSTAKNLQESAPPEQAVRAKEAFNKVWKWYSGVDKELRELEARGVRSVSICGTAETFSSRMELIETSVSVAVARAKELSRGSAKERLGELRRDAQQLTQRVEQRITEARERLAQPEPSLFTHPDQAIRQELEQRERALADAVGRQAQSAARKQLDDTRAYYARDDVKAQLSDRFHQQLAAYGDDKRERSTATALLESYDAHVSELKALDVEIAGLLSDPDVTHERLDKVVEQYRSAEVTLDGR